MAIDPMTGKPLLSQGMPDLGVRPGAPQDDGGITVRLMSTGQIHLIDDSGHGGWQLEAFRAIDVAQRMIQMGTLALQNRIRDMQGGIEVTPTKPRIDVVRGLNLPKGGA